MGSTVASGLFNALSFAGASFLFSKLSHSDYSAEMHRHNIAMEELAKAREEFYKSEVEKKDKMEEIRREKEEAERDLKLTIDELDDFKERRRKIAGESRAPVLSDFYHPSTKFQKYIYAFNILLAGGVGYGVWKLI